MSDEVLKVHATESVAKTLDDAKAPRDRIYTWTNFAVDIKARFTEWDAMYAFARS